MAAQGTSLNSKKGICYCQYSFAVDGGAMAAIVVPCSPIPSGSIITNGVIHVTTALTSGGSATIAVMCEGANDIIAATAVASYSIGAMLDVVPDGTATNFVLTTSNIESLTVTVAVATLLTGIMNIELEYFPPVG